MIRFVDLTDYYWVWTRAEDDEIRTRDGGVSLVAPVCAFVDTGTDMFRQNPSDGSQVCFAADDVTEIDGGPNGRCAGLVPPGFWDRGRG
jgi:hypothetical protein